MKRSQEFHDFVLNDVLGHISGVTSRPMFGGWGLYKDGKIFAIIALGALYFKVGENNKNEYQVRGSHPFTYTGSAGRTVSMSYWELPEEILHDRESVCDWVEASLSVVSKKKNPRRSST